MSLRSNPIIRILAIFLMLSGCASTPQHLTEESKSGIRNIAIVSLVPESVNFDKIGIISYSNKYTEFDMGNKVTDNINFVSRQRIAAAQPDWVVKSVEYDRTALLASVKSGFGFRSASTKKAFADLARDNHLDALFVVRASADSEDDMQQEFENNYLREGLNVLLKDNNLSGDAKLVIRANLSVAIIGKNGEVMAVGAIPAKLDKVEAREPDDYDVSDDMKHNHRPEVLEKVGRAVIADLAGRLDLCFDSLGFAGKAGSGTRFINTVPQPDAAIEPTEKSPAQTAPATTSFDLCFSRCRQYTDRSKEQCFDACNK